MGDARPPGVPIDDPDMTHVPTLLLDRYLVEEVLGRGGFGEVVKAYDTRLLSYRAIKTLHRTRAATNPGDFAALQGRFQREAQASSRMGVHRNIVTVHDFVADADGTLYLIMEYVPGDTLKKRLQPNPHMAAIALPMVEAVRIAAEVAQGLAAAHRQRVVHRDVKPANIFVAEASEESEAVQAKIGDFGIAQLDDVSIEGQNPYTPLYASPEQLRGEQYLTQGLFIVGRDTGSPVG